MSNNSLRLRFRRVNSDTVAAVGMWLAATAVVSALLWILFDIFRRGASHVNMSFLVSAPEDAGRAGGIGPILVSTLLILTVTLCVSAPLSLASAIALTENRHVRSRFSRIVLRCLEMLAAVPSIVFGLFGNAFFCIALGMGYSIMSGGLTLACMVLPILIRTTEQAILAVPDDYRHAAAGLGLSVGRALAETAALIFTAGYVTRMPESLQDSGRSMSVHIYDLALNVPGGSSQAYATAAVLVVLLLIINAVAIVLMRLAGLRMPGSPGGSI